MEKIIDIIESIANEKNLELESVKEKVIKALIDTAKKIYGEQYEFFVEPKNLQLFQKILIISDDDERLSEDNEHFIALSKAREEAPDVEVGDELTYEVVLENLGRTAVNTLHKELEYNIQQLLEETIFEKYQKMTGQMVFGSVVRVDSEDNTFVEIDEIRAFLPRKNRIKGEKFKVGDVLKAVIRRVYTDKNGIRMELSRTSPKFLIALLEAEVPEIKDGYVEVFAAARIPGERAKIVLKSHSANVDAVGATVGQKGVRINAVSKELHNENIDCIEFCEEPALLITRALAPAMISSVRIERIDKAQGAENLSLAGAKDEKSQDDLNLGENLANLDGKSDLNLQDLAKSKNKTDTPEKKAIVTLNTEQKSKAIGKGGINIRLASMLTGFEIELKELGGEKSEISSEEAMKNLQNLFKD